ncbi:hypothetical protein G6011_07144 [Alternaria panax]|uniref:Uncharacterized protein n=1 Tax=Alternaria panax TaxID=48097 RepID=A0AAD4F9G6_9PLEO|nr:hypothetical protein G6011_07144 [Alternaria panax]
MAARFVLLAIANAAVAQAQSFSDDYYTTTTRSTSAYWTYTARYVESMSESLYTYYDNSVTTDSYTVTRTVKDDATPTASPYSTTSDYDNYYDDLQIVYAYYTAGAVAESDLEPEYDYYATTTTASTTTTIKNIEFSMPVTITAPASCPTPFTVTTSASVDVPSQVTAQVSPTSIETYSSSTTYDNTVYVWETWYLSESAAPFTTTSDYYYSYYISDCSTPPAAYRTGSSSTGGSSGGSFNNDDDDSSYDSCYYYYCTSRIRVWIIIIASVIPGLFLLGFLESWFWFCRLMVGKSAMRFGTCCWVLISLWVLCFTRMQDRRSTEDQKLLAEKWKNMGSGAAFKAWWKWGFRHRYPEELLGQFSKTTVGMVPPGQPLYPVMAQTPGALQPGMLGGGALQPVPGAPGQVYYYGPPPPGWVQAPNGGFVPLQGYMYPPPQQAGYYGDMTKDGTVLSQSPVSTISHPQPQQQMGSVSPMVPQAPQPIYPAPQNGAHSPMPYGAPPNIDTTPAVAPSPPPQGSLPTPPPRVAEQGAPQIPPVNMSDASADDSARQQPPAPAASAPPSKNDPNDRSLYE